MCQAGYIYFSVGIMLFFPLNLFEVDALMLTACSSHSLPIQGANAVRQHHRLWRAPKMLIIKNTKYALARTFLLILSRVSIFAQQMRHSPRRTESGLVPAWLLSLCQRAGVTPRGVRQRLLAHQFVLLGFGGRSHLRSSVGAKLWENPAPERLMSCPNPQNRAAAWVSILNIRVCC